MRRPLVAGNWKMNGTRASVAELIEALRQQELPAAVEVAAYRIALEAVTNAVRHAGASRIEVRLVAGTDALVVEVRDDGAGITADARPGVGLASMRERAAEVGGWCTVAPQSPGTRVVAHLPRRTS